MAQVLNKSRYGIPEGAVYIGRGSKWGNPYPITDTDDRETVLKWYDAYLLMVNPRLIVEARMELLGKDLVCFCYPKECHGNTLMALTEIHSLVRNAPLAICQWCERLIYQSEQQWWHLTTSDIRCKVRPVATPKET